MSNSNKSIKIVSYIILITIVAKVLGFLRVIFMAKYFGTGIESSAFEAAYRIPDLLFTSIGVALSTTFIPIFTEYLSNKSKKEALFFANSVVTLLLMVTLAISAMGIIFAPYIVKFIYMGFKGEIYYITVNLVRIMFPIIVFIAISFTYVGILQSFGEFNIPAAISIPANIISILYLIFFSNMFGIYGFGIAILLSWSTQMLIQLPSLLKKDYKFEPIINFKHEGLKKMLIMIVPIFLGTSVQQVNVLVNSALASKLGDSAVSALGYANYFYVIIVGVFTYALSAVIFPSLSKTHALNDVISFKGTVNSAIRAILYILTPAMIGLLILNMPIIKVLLERGRFDQASTALTSSVLFYFSFGMIGFGIQEVLNKSFYALHNTKTPMKISMAGMTLNIVLSIILVRYMGLSGLALSASISSIFIGIFLIISLNKQIPQIIEKRTIVLGTKTLISSVIMGFAVYYGYNFLLNFFDISIFSLLILMVLGVTIYFLCTLVQHTEESTMAINIIRSKLFKSKESEV